MLFYKFLLQSQQSANKKQNPDYVARLASSFASDIIAAVSQGKTITNKQFLLALGLHNITGQRKVVDILSRLGHCLTYNTRTIKCFSSPSSSWSKSLYHHSVLGWQFWRESWKADRVYIGEHYPYASISIEGSRQFLRKCANITVNP